MIRIKFVTGLVPERWLVKNLNNKGANTWTPTWAHGAKGVLTKEQANTQETLRESERRTGYVQVPCAPWELRVTHDELVQVLDNDPAIVDYIDCYAEEVALFSPARWPWQKSLQLPLGQLILAPDGTFRCSIVQSKPGIASVTSRCYGVDAHLDFWNTVIDYSLDVTA